MEFALMTPINYQSSIEMKIKCLVVIAVIIVGLKWHMCLLKLRSTKNGFEFTHVKLMQLFWILLAKYAMTNNSINFNIVCHSTRIIISNDKWRQIVYQINIKPQLKIFEIIQQFPEQI